MSAPAGYGAPPSPPVTPMDGIVQNWGLWGEMIKCWATGRAHPGSGKVYPVPRSLVELKEQCRETAVGLDLPAHVTGLVIYTHDRNVLVLRLPPKEVVEAQEVQLAQGGASYPIPSFYADAFEPDTGDPTNRKVRPKVLTATEALAFDAKRIGDYTITYCGG